MKTGPRGQRLWVYPQSIGGKFHTLHKWTSLALHLFLVVTPWLTLNGYPLLRFDVGNRRVYALGQIFTTADSVLLMLFALTAAFSLFFFTSIFGRLWCGYACPQSVFLINWVMPIETWIEGDRNQRMRRDAGPLTFDKAWRKVAKWSLFLVVSLGVSLSFMGFFAGPMELLTGQASATQYAVVAFFTALWMFDFSYMREQVCNYLCPYARFQSALMDDQSLLISYSVARGEPRAKGKRKPDAAPAGDCVDCDKCVVVCPQGIDIRDGFQLECIACGRCADACTSVQSKLGRETLISYQTLAATEGRPSTLVRPRTLLYASLLTALVAAILGVVAFHNPIEFQVNRAPGTHFTIDPDQRVRNTYLVKITNRDPSPTAKTFHVRVEGLPQAEVTVQPVTLKSNEATTIPLMIRTEADAVTGRSMTFNVIVETDGASRSHLTTFAAPLPNQE